MSQNISRDVIPLKVDWQSVEKQSFEFYPSWTGAK
jgi:hypothetical protein